VLSGRGLCDELITRPEESYRLCCVVVCDPFYVKFPHGATALSRPGPPQYRGFSISLRQTIFGRTPLGHRSAQRINLYLTTHNTHKRQTSVRPAAFEPTIPASERPQTHTSDRAATEIGLLFEIWRGMLPTLQL